MTDPQEPQPPKQKRGKRRRRSRQSSLGAPKLPRVRLHPDTPALVIFGLIVILGPLAFGAVDQLIQVGLLALFSLGLLLRPPKVVSLTPRASALLLALTVILVLKEFAPAALFGGTTWRKTLVDSFSLALPWTHHPEPGRAIDSLLAIGVGVLWFLWVRTLAGRRENRAPLAWILFAAVVLVAAVSFATKGMDDRAIYGLRYTPGWRGFGPFPNRNHTACFLAMGTVIGMGCLAWAGARRRYLLLGFGSLIAVIPLAALMATQSRGGLLAFAVGGALYAVMLVWKLRTKRAVAIIATAGLAAVGFALSFGAPLLARFTASESGVSNLTRRLVWSDALFMWRDAPLFGHGAGAFASIFPMYQRIQLDNQVVLHPESSWLQALTEFGLIPLLLALVAALWVTPAHLREIFQRRHGFFIVAAGLCAGVVLLVHSAIDVPAHRWGTAGFALAAFALGLPPRRGGALATEWNLQQTAWQRAARRSALVPFAIALFWSLPFWAGWPAWSPIAAAQLTDRANTRASVSTPQIDRELVSFPLNSALHQLRGFHELQRELPQDAVWLRHFRLALRLNPGSWSLPVAQALACGNRAPLVSISFWQQAIERSGMRAQEIFGNALADTADIPAAKASWGTYVETHPALALAYARTLPAEEGRPFFETWWRERALRPDVTFDEMELRTFYEVAPQWATREQFEQWMRAHAARGIPDFRAWAAVLHAWHDDQTAWRVLARRTPEPPWPTVPTNIRVDVLEMRWRRVPQNLVNAQQLATGLFRQGDVAKALEVMLATAAVSDGSSWFAQKAAYLLATDARYTEAVALLLKAATAPRPAPALAAPGPTLN